MKLQNSGVCLIVGVQMKLMWRSAELTVVLLALRRGSRIPVMLSCSCACEGALAVLQKAALPIFGILPKVSESLGPAVFLKHNLEPTTLLAWLLKERGMRHHQCTFCVTPWSQHGPGSLQNVPCQSRKPHESVPSQFSERRPFSNPLLWAPISESSSRPRIGLCFSFQALVLWAPANSRPGIATLSTLGP